eukprot:TRINITY_DN67092_c0_g1_i2.p1 TRINITY_DN67092_c0_g1~~TRINITY_DN67092_c0_g1_i2.p1  ORF type:complete len:133 (-),score=12.18 TRINITY_DN67092_c0_g1_i2:454-852(-)
MLKNVMVTKRRTRSNIFEMCRSARSTRRRRSVSTNDRCESAIRPLTVEKGDLAQMPRRQEELYGDAWSTQEQVAQPSIDIRTPPRSAQRLRVRRQSFRTVVPQTSSDGSGSRGTCSHRARDNSEQAWVQVLH